MPEINRPQFGLRIIDLIVFVAATAIAVAGGLGITNENDVNQGRIAFWLVFAGVILVSYLAIRFGRSREDRLIVIGLAVAFAGAADAMFMDSYMNSEASAMVVGAGLSAVGFLLIAGGLIHGFRGTRPIEARAATHPLDEDHSK